MRKIEKKRLIVNHKKLFSFKKSTSILKNNDLENYFDEVRMFLEDAILKN